MGIFSTTYNPKLFDFSLLLLRITVGCFMMSHGLTKLPMLVEGGAADFADPIGLGPAVSLGLVVFAEVICSFLLMLGLATRLAALVLIINMFIIVFVMHGADGFGKQELPGLYLAIYVIILMLGAGRFSIDHLIEGRKRKVNY